MTHFASFRLTVAAAAAAGQGQSAEATEPLDTTLPNREEWPLSSRKKTPTNENVDAGVGFGADHSHTGTSVSCVAATGIDDAHAFENTNMGAFGSHLMLGLTISGVAQSLLTTVFSLFHVDVFLRAYELPLATYSTGSFIFSIINTLNDLYGAWLVDSLAATRSNSRIDLIGWSGFLFSLCFLTPFFRWKKPSTALWDGGHFVITMALYDTLYSFSAILMGSAVTDNHTMSDRDRVWFMASGKIANLVTSFAVARIGLAMFDDEGNDLSLFRLFLVALAALVSILFGYSHVIMSHGSMEMWLKHTLSRPHRKKRAKDDAGSPSSSLRLQHVIKDFWHHNNFWAWIGMELLLESQVNFVGSFSKMFVDRLLFDGGGLSRSQCDWLLSIMRPISLISGIACYIPIRTFGYRRVYPALFVCNFVMALAMWLFASHMSTSAIVAFLLVYPAATGAVLSSGFHLAMSDMVLELKRQHAKEGRTDAASLAGLYMGANALFCKPAESLLPILAARLLNGLDITSPSADPDRPTEELESMQEALYKLLILPPLVFSVLQWLSWRRYSLTPKMTNQMRQELQKVAISLIDNMA